MIMITIMHTIMISDKMALVQEVLARVRRATMFPWTLVRLLLRVKDVSTKLLWYLKLNTTTKSFVNIVTQKGVT